MQAKECQLDKEIIIKRIKVLTRRHNLNFNPKCNMISVIRRDDGQTNDEPCMYPRSN